MWKKFIHFFYFIPFFKDRLTLFPTTDDRPTQTHSATEDRRKTNLTLNDAFIYNLSDGGRNKRFRNLHYTLLTEKQLKRIVRK